MSNERSHTDRAARMGYGSPTAAVRRPAAVPNKSIFKGSELELPLLNYYSRKEAPLRMRKDVEGLESLRKEREQLKAFAAERKISREDLQTALSVVQHYDEWPRSEEAKTTLKTQFQEKQRLEHGGTEQRKAHMRMVGSVTKALETAVPSLVARVRATGAAVDPRLFDALAPYGEKAG